MIQEEVYKVIIVDDERTSVDNLRRELLDYPEFKVDAVASNGARGRKLILEQHPDLLFLDVELPDILGLNLLSEIRHEVSWNMKVVFYTAYDKYMLQALRESAFDFLLKPFDPKELGVIMGRYRKERSLHQLPPSFVSSLGVLLPARDAFVISTVTGFKLLHLEEIGFFEYSRKARLWQVVLFSQVRLSLKNHTRAEEILGYSDSFMQINQAVIINVNYLALIEGRFCRLYPPFNAGDDLVVSRSFLKDLQDKFCTI